MGRKTHYDYDQSEELRAEKVNEHDNDISSSDSDQHKRGGLRLITELIPPQDRVGIFRHLPVKKGVLLVLCLKERCTLELWNFQLSKCIERWGCLGQFQRVIPVSEELVCLISPSSPEVKIFHTSSFYERSAMCLPGKFIACNSKYQFLATLDSHSQTIVLLQGKTVIRKKYWPRSGYGNFICETFSFSPDNQFFVISGRSKGMVFIYWMLIQEVHFRCYGKGKLTEVFLSVTTNVSFKPQSHQVLHVSDYSTLNLGSN